MDTFTFGGGKDTSILYVSTAAAAGMAAVAAAITITFIRYLFQSSKTQNAKKPIKLPPYGPAFSDFLAAMSGNNIARSQMEWVHNYGKLFTFVSPLPGIIPYFVCCADAEVYKTLCSTHINNYRAPYSFSRGPTFAAAVRATTGNGITSMVGAEWQWRKNAFIKEFHRSRLFDEDRALFEAITQAGQRLHAEFARAGETGETLLLDVLTTRAATDVAVFMLVGRQLEFDAEVFRAAAHTLMKHIVYSLTTPLLGRLLNLPHYFEMERRRRAARAVFDSVLRGEIEALLQETEKAAAAVAAAVKRGATPEDIQHIYANNLPTNRDRKPFSVIESLLVNEPCFRSDAAQVLEEARVFILAGFDTTAHSLAFTFGLLAEPRYKNVADTLAAEARAALKGAAVPTRAAIEASPGIGHLFSEALRLFPLVPMLGGECVAPVTLTYNGEEYTLPAGTGVQFLNLALQRDSDLAGPDPDTLKLSRWAAPIDQQPFIGTFNKGAHLCPGKPLSMLEAHIFLLCTLRDFEFVVPTGGNAEVQFEEDLLLRPKNKMPLLIKKRIS